MRKQSDSIPLITMEAFFRISYKIFKLMKKLIVASVLTIMTFYSQLTAQNEQDFFAIDKIQQLNISFVQENWSYLLDSLRINGDEMLLGAVEINGQKFEDVGVRYKENRGFRPGTKRNSYEISLDFIKKGQHMDGMTGLLLSEALRDPAMIREVVSYKIAGAYLPSPRANYASLAINEEEIGLFVNIEKVDVNFIKKHFNAGSEVSFYKSNPDYTVGKGMEGCASNAFGSLKMEKSADCFDFNFDDLTGNGFGALAKFSEALNSNTKDIEGLADVDQFLWMHAINNVLVNLYSYSGRYSQNYYLLEDSDGVFHPILGDMNLSFGSFKSIGFGSDLKLKQLQELDPMLHLDEGQFPLVSQLLSNPFYKKVYLSHFNAIVADFFKDGKFEKDVQSLQASIRGAIEADPNKEYSLEEFDKSLTETIGTRSQIPGILELMDKRLNFIRKNKTLRILPPSISKVEVKKRAQFSNEQINEFRICATVDKFPKEVQLFFRANDNGPFQKLLMKDDGNSNDQEANDGVFGATVTGIESIEYYILAENAKAISYDPSNYVSEVHRATLKEINR